jgi:hypothetical protein
MSNTLSLTGGLIGGLILGVGAGYALHSFLEDPVEVILSEPMVIKEHLTAEEIAAFCEDEVKDERASLGTAQDKVTDLQSRLDARESELSTLQKEAQSKKASAGAAWMEMKKKVEALEAEVATLETELQGALVERDDLLVELKQTVVALEQQIKATQKQKERGDKFKAESHQNLWTTFAAQANVNICDRGSRKRHDKCHDAVAEALNKSDVQNKFIECDDTNQATPVLVQAERNDRKTGNLPPYAKWLDDDSRFTNKGWYVQFCDPSLPEADIGAAPG